MELNVCLFQRNLQIMQKVFQVVTMINKISNIGLGSNYNVESPGFAVNG